MQAKSGKGNGVLIFALATLAAIFIPAFLFSPGRDGPSHADPSVSLAEAQIAAQRRTRAIEFEAALPRLMGEGGIHSVDVDANLVRFDPAIWASFPLEVKQGLVMQFSDYFGYKGSTGRVTIRSNRNDTIFATYSVWDGVKILY